MLASRSNPAWRAALRALTLLAALAAAATAQALSLGGASLQSRIGEPLRVSIALGNLGPVTAQEIVVGRAPDADYARLGVDRAAQPSALRFELSADKRGDASIEVSSERPVHEPFVDIVVEVRWPTGRLVKQYTFLLDLPPR